MLISGSQIFQRRGANFSGLNGNGATQTVISAASNTTGILIRTLALIAPGAVGSYGAVQIDNQDVFTLFQGNQFNLTGVPFFVPAGRGIQFATTAAGGNLNMTWDAV